MALLLYLPAARTKAKENLDFFHFPLDLIIVGSKKNIARVSFNPSSLVILSDRRPAKQLLYDPLRYGVLSSDAHIL